MLKKTITYTDYDGNERTEDFYFNISKAELTELQFSVKGGLKNILEKAVKEKEKEESESNRIASPYTKAAPIKSNKQFIFILVLIVVLIVIAIIWSIKQITVGSTGANIASYFNK